MKLTCICCGERWDAQHVFRDKPEDFNRATGVIRACPSCHGSEPDGMTEEERIRLRAIAVIQQPLAAELERLAASDVDLNGITFHFGGHPSKLAKYLEKIAVRVAHAKRLKLPLEGLDASTRKD